MKRSVKLLFHPVAGIILMSQAFSIYMIGESHAQEDPAITGKLIDQYSTQAVPFANVYLMKASDSTLIDGTISDCDGIFIISPVFIGSYRLYVSAIGYQPAIKRIDVADLEMINAGTIFLQDTAYMLDETVVVGDRLKARSEKERTTFYVTKSMLDVSNRGIDMLKLIPGIQVDILHQISLDGSKDILVFVDGKERDRNFISQLNPKQIDKVEVIRIPPSDHDGNITGAINIILKTEKDPGISGQIYTEIPTSRSEVYIFPSFNLNYGFKKLNLFTSYNGEITCLDIHERTYRKLWNSGDTNEITSNQYLRQKDWSHRFHFGFDYFLSPSDQFNFYAFVNPYSREHDGIAETQISGHRYNHWTATKEDTDINVSTFYSIYYKHVFDKEGREIALDVSRYHLKAENTTNYVHEASEGSPVMQVNSVKPDQHATSIKLDYTTPLWNQLNLSTGVKARFQFLRDRYSPGFNYCENIFGAYGTVSYRHAKIDLSLGLRAEKSVSSLKNSFSNHEFSLLPYSAFRYKYTAGQSILLSYKRSVSRPNLYQLNPFISFIDPYTLQQGNPLLEPELRSIVSLEHSIRFKSHYFSSGLFYHKQTDVIHNLTLLNDTGTFETHAVNLGTVHQYGVQFLASWKAGNTTLNPYFRLFNLSSCGNPLARRYAVENRQNLAFESGLSAMVSFKHDLAFSLVFQYNSPKNNIQDNTFCDALYFLSLEKTFKQKIKAGIVSAIPFTRSFIYQGSEINACNFYSHYEGNVKITFPFWFKLSYQFNPGKKEYHDHFREEIDKLPKKGF